MKVYIANNPHRLTYLNAGSVVGSGVSGGSGALRRWIPARGSAPVEVGFV